jgi:NADPH2:quinone reductase
VRALQLQEFGGPSALQVAEIDEPAPGAGEVVLEVRAVGINFPDLLSTSGAYQLKPNLPFVPGCEVAGEIRSAPEDSGWRAGDRAAAFVWSGGYAERVAVPVAQLMRLPDSVDFTTAAALVVNYHTVHFALDRRARLKADESVLVLGAAGGIGTAAVQVAKAMGARVLGGVANTDQLAVARGAGADDVLILGDAFAAEVLDGFGPIDVVVDPLGDRFFGESLRTLAPEGRVVVIGFAAGEIPVLKLNRLLLRNASALGVAWGAFLEHDPTVMATSSAALSAMSDRGALRPQIGRRVAFADIPQALAELQRGEIAGKAVAHGPREPIESTERAR